MNGTPQNTPVKPKRKLFEQLKGDGLFTKDFATFENYYSDPETRDKLYEGLKQDGLVTVDSARFHDYYFGGEQSDPKSEKGEARSKKPVDLSDRDRIKNLNRYVADVSDTIGDLDDETKQQVFKSLGESDLTESRSNVGFQSKLNPSSELFTGDRMDLARAINTNEKARKLAMERIAGNNYGNIDAARVEENLEEFGRIKEAEERVTKRGETINTLQSQINTTRERAQALRGEAVEQGQPTVNTKTGSLFRQKKIIDPDKYDLSLDLEREAEKMEETLAGLEEEQLYSTGSPGDRDEMDESVFEQTVEEFAKGIGRGLVNLPKSLATLKSYDMSNPAQALLAKNVQQILQRANESERLAQDREFKTRTLEDVYDEPANLIPYLTGKVGEAAPTMLPGLTAAKFLTGAGRAAQIAGAAMASSPIETAAQLEELEGTADERGTPATAGEKALAVASGLLSSGVEGVADASLMRGILRGLNKTGLEDTAKEAAKKEIADGITDIAVSGAKQFGRGFGIESATEGVQQVIANAGAKYGWDAERAFGEGIIEASVVGGFTGGPVTGVTSVVGDVAGKEREAKSKKQGVRSEKQGARSEERQRSSPGTPFPESLGTGKGGQTQPTAAKSAPSQEGTNEARDLKSEVGFTYDPEGEPDVQLEQLNREERRLSDERARAEDAGDTNLVQEYDTALEGLNEVKGEVEQATPLRPPQGGTTTATTQEEVDIEPAELTQPVEVSEGRYRVEAVQTEEARREKQEGSSPLPRFRVVDSETGKPLSRSSRNFNPAFAEFLTSEQVKNSPRVAEMGISQSSFKGSSPGTPFKGGQNQPAPQNLEEYLKLVASESSNPIELVEAYEDAVLLKDQIDEGADTQVFESEAMKIRPDDVNRVMGSNFLPDNRILYTQTSKEATPLDVQAEIYSERLGREVTEQEIIEYRLDALRRSNDFTGLRDRIKERFKNVTGVGLTDSLVREVQQQQIQEFLQDDGTIIPEVQDLIDNYIDENGRIDYTGLWEQELSDDSGKGFFTSFPGDLTEQQYQRLKDEVEREAGKNNKQEARSEEQEQFRSETTPQAGGPESADGSGEGQVVEGKSPHPEGEPRGSRLSDAGPVSSQRFGVTSEAGANEVRIKTQNKVASKILSESDATWDNQRKTWLIKPEQAAELQAALDAAEDYSDSGLKHLYTAPQPANAPYKGGAEFIGQKYQPETRKGSKLIKRIQNDAEGTKAGVRSIVDFLNDLTGVDLRVAKSQTSKKHPAHFEPLPMLVRSRVAAWQYNFHEAGHAISRRLKDNNPVWWSDIKSRLEDLTHTEGNHASAKTAEEGFAEFVRLFITDPNTLENALKNDMVSRMEESHSDIAKGLRDAHRAWDAHKNRSTIAQFRQYSYDHGQKPALKDRIVDLFDRFMFSGMSIEHALTRINRKTFKSISKLGKEHSKNLSEAWDTGPVSYVKELYKTGKAKFKAIQQAEAFEESLKDSPADSKIALQAYLRAPIDAHFAIHGDKNIKREGIRIRWWHEGSFDEIFPEETKSELESAGYTIPDAQAAFGHDVFLSDKSISTIKQDIGKDSWDEFQWYGYMKESLQRHKNKGHEYQGLADGLTPEMLETEVGRIEKKHPEWVDAFGDVNSYFDQLALISYISGEKTVGDLTRIKEGIDSYWPMPRRVQNASGGSGISRARPDAGIRRAHGSQKPLVSLDEAIETRTRKALEAYYWNNVLLSVRNMSQEIENRRDLPLDARSAVHRMMVPLKLDVEKVATMKPDEGKQLIADYLNEQLFEQKIENLLADEQNDLTETDIRRLIDAQQGGTFSSLPPAFRLEESEQINPEQIEVSWNGKDLWRAKEPALAKVVAPFENGQRQFYEVSDPILFDMMSHSKDPGQWMNYVTETINPITESWKRPLTNNVIFSAWQLASRDIPQGVLMGQGWRSYVPGFYAAEGIINRITGKNPEAIESGALLTKAFSNVTSDAHKTRVEKFMDVLKEGIILPEYGNMSTGEKLRAAPGQAFSATLKPVEMLLYATGQRSLSITMESLPREGAWIEAIEQGKSPAAAQEQYDKLTGNFGSYPGNAKILATYRMAGFLNPGVQVFYQHYQRLFNHNPKVAAKSWAVKIPYIAATYAAGAAVNWLMTDEEDRERLKERPDTDRLRYMAWFGRGRVPFDYGITGLAATYGWNSVEGMLLDNPVESEALAQAIIERSLDLPGHPASFMPPMAKTALELQTNYSFFFGEPIVPGWMEDVYGLNPELQHYESTPELYKFLGKKLDISPLKIQYFTRQALTNQMDEAIIALDSFTKGKEYDELSEIPFIGRTFTKEPRGFRSKSVRKLGELDQQYRALSQQYNRYAEDPTTDRAQLQALTEKMRKLYNAHGFAKEIERVYQAVKQERKKNNPNNEFIKRMERMMTDLAQQYFRSNPEQLTASNGSTDN